MDDKNFNLSLNNVVNSLNKLAENLNNLNNIFSDLNKSFNFQNLELKKLNQEKTLLDKIGIDLNKNLVKNVQEFIKIDKDLVENNKKFISINKEIIKNDQSFLKLNNDILNSTEKFAQKQKDIQEKTLNAFSKILNKINKFINDSVAYLNEKGLRELKNYLLAPIKVFTGLIIAPIRNVLGGLINIGKKFSDPNTFKQIGNNITNFATKVSSVFKGKQEIGEKGEITKRALELKENKPKEIQTISQTLVTFSKFDIKDLKNLLIDRILFFFGKIGETASEITIRNFYLSGILNANKINLANTDLKNLFKSPTMTSPFTITKKEGFDINKLSNFGKKESGVGGVGGGGFNLKNIGGFFNNIFGAFKNIGSLIRGIFVALKPVVLLALKYLLIGTLIVAAIAAVILGFFIIKYELKKLGSSLDGFKKALSASWKAALFPITSKIDSIKNLFSYFSTSFKIFIEAFKTLFKGDIKGFFKILFVDGFKNVLNHIKLSLGRIPFIGKFFKKVGDATIMKDGNVIEASDKDNIIAMKQSPLELIKKIGILLFKNSPLFKIGEFFFKGIGNIASPLIGGGLSLVTKGLSEVFRGGGINSLITREKEIYLLMEINKKLETLIEVNIDGTDNLKKLREKGESKPGFGEEESFWDKLFKKEPSSKVVSENKSAPLPQVNSQ